MISIGGCITRIVGSAHCNACAMDEALGRVGLRRALSAALPFVLGIRYGDIAARRACPPIVRCVGSDVLGYGQSNTLL